MRRLLKQLFCRHMNVDVVRVIYGDEINLFGGKRMLCKCKRCGREMAL